MSLVKMILQAVTFLWLIAHAPAWMIGCWAIYYVVSLFVSIDAAPLKAETSGFKEP